MMEKWKNSLDRKNIAGALFTDLSKVFDCLNHELLIAKLDAYGFNIQSLSYIYSYLTKRKQRTKINNSFSDWFTIKSGIPQGSILSPLLFNLYLNDIFYFVKEDSIASYADDNTHYAIGESRENVINILNQTVSILLLWFKNNYFKMNIEKCHLMLTNYGEEVTGAIAGQHFVCENSVRCSYK